MVEAEGERLIIDGPTRALTDEIVAAVQTKKADLLQLIRPLEDRQCWHAEDWQAYFDERAAIREHDGGLPRVEAEHLALEETITQWLRLNPDPASDPRCGCVHCGLPEQPGNSLLPVLALGGQAWVHDWCWAPWMAALRDEARDALLSAGIQVGHPRGSCRRRSR
ncbi:hypothetical protein KBI52_08460 [Microvirga sp. HBU67558]|nr:hypothetical protein [Microvirga sp. HBU67558]